MTHPTKTVRARAAAKINLHLGVGGVRADGFHELHTVYQAISLFDEVSAVAADDWTVETTTSDYVDADALPDVADNIVTRAAALLADRNGIPARGSVRVDKAIPVAGGLAGGSADAAAALVVLDRLWDLRTPHQDLYTLAAELGSDVPFSLLGGTGLGTGRGEVVEALDDPGHWWWVVVPDRRGMATPAVYRHFDELNPGAGPPAPAPGLVRALTSRDPGELGPTLRNDLQEAAFDLRPDLRELVARGEAEGAVRGLLSGSGPTCLFLCEDGAHAGAVADGLRGAGSETVLVATGPAPGATVVTD